MWWSLTVSGEGVPESECWAAEGSGTHGTEVWRGDGEQSSRGWAEGAGGSVFMKEVTDREPVKLDENMGDVVRWSDVGDDPGGRVLDDLQSVDEFGGQSVRRALQLSIWEM